MKPHRRSHAKRRAEVEIGGPLFFPPGYFELFEDAASSLRAYVAAGRGHWDDLDAPAEALARAPLTAACEALDRGDDYGARRVLLTAFLDLRRRAGDDWRAMVAIKIDGYSTYWDWRLPERRAAEDLRDALELLRIWRAPDDYFARRLPRRAPWVFRDVATAIMVCGRFAFLNGRVRNLFAQLPADRQLRILESLRRPERRPFRPKAGPGRKRTRDAKAAELAQAAERFREADRLPATPDALEAAIIAECREAHVDPEALVDWAERGIHGDVVARVRDRALTRVESIAGGREVEILRRAAAEIEISTSYAHRLRKTFGAKVSGHGFAK